MMSGLDTLARNKMFQNYSVGEDWNQFRQRKMRNFENRLDNSMYPMSHENLWLMMIPPLSWPDITIIITVIASLSLTFPLFSFHTGNDETYLPAMAAVLPLQPAAAPHSVAGEQRWRHVERYCRMDRTFGKPTQFNVDILKDYSQLWVAILWEKFLVKS